MFLKLIYLAEFALAKTLVEATNQVSIILAKLFRPIRIIPNFRERIVIRMNL
jgi:hypothetical protein